MIKVDTKELKDMRKRYSKVQSQAKTVIARAMTRVGDNARTNAKKEIAKDYVIKSGDVNKTLSSTKASATSTSTIVRSKSRGTGLDKYKFTPKKVRGKGEVPKVIKAAVKKGGSVKKIKNAFVGNKNGLKIFVREGKKRLPIRRLYGPPAPEMFNQKRIREPVEEAAHKMFEDRVIHELNRELKP